MSYVNANDTDYRSVRTGRPISKKTLRGIAKAKSKRQKELEKRAPCIVMTMVPGASEPLISVVRDDTGKGG
jgi:hypothetical protein